MNFYSHFHKILEIFDEKGTKSILRKDDVLLLELNE